MNQKNVIKNIYILFVAKNNNVIVSNLKRLMQNKAIMMEQTKYIFYFNLPYEIIYIFILVRSYTFSFSITHLKFFFISSTHYIPINHIFVSFLSTFLIFSKFYLYKNTTGKREYTPYFIGILFLFITHFTSFRRKNFNINNAK